MQVIHLFGTIIYFAMLVGLSCYGVHRYLMIYLYYKYRKQTPKPAGHFATLPKVTVQLPLYNEMYVAERLLDAVVALDYPKDKLEVQVLDDSTDETTEIVAHKAAELRQQGFDVSHVHRSNRHGYKAGALEHGLQTATGEFIAIFDADFVPQPDLLQTTIQYFTDPNIGMIQTRWGHLNEHYSMLTRLQSMFLDGHFLIEQTARARSGRFFNFNGTAGIWRRTCIISSGGWQHDTLAEDLDLSYRAQIKGWQFLFLPNIVTPAELPVEMNAFKSQQHRWAKGSVQAGKKMLPVLWRTKLPLKIKIEGTVHLTSNIGHLMLLILCLLFHSSASTGTNQATGGNPWTKMQNE
jgi:cellulose synthase/poly-beta-1,6-N-acetylglucosamine synthase-like glycosyltransferase